MEKIIYDSVMVFKAEEFSRIKHEGQFRRDGITSYIVHPKEVVELCGDDNFLKIVGWLHDLYEDTNTTKEELEQQFGNEVENAVWTLTHKEEDTYKEYILGIKDCNDSRIVYMKICDIVANLTDVPNKKQILKYIEALSILCNKDI